MVRHRVVAAGTSAASKQLIARVGAQVRRMGAQSVLTSLAVAGRFGIHTTDLECLDLIALRKQASAGELADATGLTSGAVTALVDRLERAGYVARVADPVDRRRREVRIRPESIKPIAAVYKPMQARMIELWSSFSSDELDVVLDFLSRSTDLAVACTERIRVDPASPHSKRLPARSGRGRIGLKKTL